MNTESTLWRQRAAADREAAEAETLSNARDRLISSADTFDRMAAHAEAVEERRQRMEERKALRSKLIDI